MTETNAVYGAPHNMIHDTTVVIPVGPHHCHEKWLKECFDSVLNQTYPPDNIIVVDDSCGEFLKERPTICFSESRKRIENYFDLPHDGWGENNRHGDYGSYIWYPDCGPRVTYYATPWNLGVDAAFNIGIALSQTNLVFTLGSDDIMLPTCLEECVKEYEKRKVEGWYNVTVELQSGEIMALANNTAMITKKLWEWTGGFPPSAGIGGCDALLLSILLKHEPHKIIQVKPGTPLCWLREHKDQDTKRHAAKFNKEVISVRNIMTDEWKPRATS